MTTIDHAQQLYADYFTFIERTLAQFGPETYLHQINTDNFRLDRPLLKVTRSIVEAIEQRATAVLDLDGELKDIDPGVVTLDVTDARDLGDWEFDTARTLEIAARPFQAWYTERPKFAKRIDRYGEIDSEKVDAWITAVRVKDGRCIVVVELGER